MLHGRLFMNNMNSNAPIGSFHTKMTASDLFGIWHTWCVYWEALPHQILTHFTNCCQNYDHPKIDWKIACDHRRIWGGAKGCFAPLDSCFAPLGLFKQWSQPLQAGNYSQCFLVYKKRTCNRRLLIYYALFLSLNCTLWEETGDK